MWQHPADRKTRAIWIQLPRKSRVSPAVKKTLYMTVFYGSFVRSLFVLACYEFSVHNIAVVTVSNPWLPYQHLQVFREKAVHRRDFGQANGH